MDLKDIKAIVELMKKNELTVFQLERDEFKLLIKSEKGRQGGAEGGYSIVAPQGQPGYAISASPTPAPSAPAAPAPAPAEAKATTRDITSPMVGTFYMSPAPDSPPFVKVGQKVTEDSVVCIIEAMKVMNEIKAEMKGTIVEIVADNGKPVQYGAPLFRVEPS